METMKLAISIDKAEALKAGSPVYGETTIEVTEELLAMLEPDTRAYLALADRSAELPTSLGDWGQTKYSPVDVPPNYNVRDIAESIVSHQKAWELSQLKAKLEKESKAQKAAEKEAEQKQKADDVALAMSAMSDEELFAECYRDAWTWCEVPAWIGPGRGDPRVESRLATIQSQCETTFRAAENVRREEKKAQDATDKSDYAAFVEAHCDENQRERFAEGKLPTEEVLALKRSLVFPTGFEEYKRLQAKDFEHEESCYESKAKFHASEYDGGLGPKAWEVFRAIRDEVLRGTPNAEIEIRQHEMWCGECDAERIYRYGVKVSWEWAGHELVREYALGNPRD